MELAMIKRLYNKRVVLPHPRIHASELLDYVNTEFKKKISDYEENLRWAIVASHNNKIIIEMVLAEMLEPKNSYIMRKVCGMTDKKAVVHIVPTGVRANEGGYIGDAGPFTNLLASTTDYVITNPNTVNAAMVNYASPNVLYVEGYALDKFFTEELILEPITGLNHIGLLIDKAATRDEKIIDLLFATVDTCRVAGGMNIKAYTITRDVVGGESFQNLSGAFSGKIKNPATLLAGAETLLQTTPELDTIAVTTHIRIPKNALTLYHQGSIPDPHGGLEAIISHFLSWQTRKMVAHAPILSRKEIENMLFGMKTVDPRAAGEIVGAAGFLGCVFKGLSKSPRLIWLSKETLSRPALMQGNMLHLQNVIAVVTPYNALGGIPMLAAAAKKIPIIAVLENKTLLTVTKDSLRYGRSVIEVENYFQAAALVRELPFRHNHLHLSQSDLTDLTTKGLRIAEETGIDMQTLRRPIEPFKNWAQIE